MNIKEWDESGCITFRRNAGGLERNCGFALNIVVVR